MNNILEIPVPALNKKNLQVCPAIIGHHEILCESSFGWREDGFIFSHFYCKWIYLVFIYILTLGISFDDLFYMWIISQLIIHICSWHSKPLYHCNADWLLWQDLERLAPLRRMFGKNHDHENQYAPNGKTLYCLLAEYQMVIAEKQTYHCTLHFYWKFEY